MPHDFPPYKDGLRLLRQMEADGTTGQIHDLLRGKACQAAGRGEQPSTAILDGQSVKNSGNMPESSQGIDAGKLMKGSYLRYRMCDTILICVLCSLNGGHTSADSPAVGYGRLRAPLIQGGQAGLRCSRDGPRWTIDGRRSAARPLAGRGQSARPDATQTAVTPPGSDGSRIPESFWSNGGQVRVSSAA